MFALYAVTALNLLSINTYMISSLIGIPGGQDHFCGYDKWIAVRLDMWYMKIT